MLIEGGCDDDDVIQVAKGMGFQFRGDDGVDEALKGGGCRVQAERHDSKLHQAAVRDGECREWFTVPDEQDLQISVLQVDG